MRPRDHYPSQRPTPTTKVLHLCTPGFQPRMFEGRRYADGVEYLTARLIAFGWGAYGSREWAQEMVRRYPAMASDEYVMVPEIIDRLMTSIPDPADVDQQGMVLNMLDFFWRSV